MSDPVPELSRSLRDCRSTLLTPHTSKPPGWAGVLGPLGVYAYIMGFAVPLPWDLPLLVLGVCAIFTLGARSSTCLPAWSPLVLFLLLFLVTTGLSTLGSINVGRSIRFSAPFLPALLLFGLMAESGVTLREIRFLYLTFSTVALGLALVVLGTLWYTQNHYMHSVILNVGSPLLAVPNDVTFLAVVAPLSWALLCHKPRGGVGLLALLSLLASGGAICAFRSRTALLTLVVALPCAVTLLRPQRYFAQSVVYGFACLLCLLLIDMLLGFPLATKVIRDWSDLKRLGYWAITWTMFGERPWLGQGPYTFGLFHRTPWAHNLYLEILAERGLVGLTAFGGLLVCGMSAAWRLRHAAARDVRLYGAGLWQGS